MTLSIIIPTLNEADTITQCVGRLLACNPSAEIIVVDSGSIDDTFRIAREAGAIVFSVAKKSRAFQMNYGAKQAKGDVFYFVHSDTLPPASFGADIEQAMQEGYEIGRFRFRFDSKKIMLRINSWFTRFDKMWVSGGDETLFITKNLFYELKGYDETFIIMEEYNLVQRARKTAPYKVIQKDVLVSARKYEHNSWIAVQRANLRAFRLFKDGAEPEFIRQTYYNMIRHPKDLP